MPIRTKSLAATALGLFLLLLAWLVWSTLDPSLDTPANRAAMDREPTGAAATAALARAATAGPAADDATATRQAVPSLLAEPELAPAPAALRRGRMLDSRGQPLADVPVGLAPFDWKDRHLQLPADAAIVRTDVRGEFALPAAPQTMAPVAGTGFCTLRTTLAEPGAETPLLVVAARSVSLAGRIRRPDGESIAGALVSPAVFFLTEFPLPLEHTFIPDAENGTSDERGDYAVRELPLAAGLELRFSCQGYTPLHVPSEQAAAGRLDVVLEPFGGKAERLRGRVQDGRGPLAGVKLQLGYHQEAESDARGEFSFELPPKPARLLAMARGYQPVVREDVGADAREVVIEFSAPALKIEGTVQFADGKPASGWRLDLLDALRGRNQGSVEAACSEGPVVEGALAQTDAAGHFALGGLSERSYRLLAYDPQTAVAVQSEPIAAGTVGVVLVVPAAAVLGELRGQIVDRRGLPVADAGLLCYLTTASADGIIEGPRAQTGPDGRFLLKNVPCSHVQLGVSGEDIDYQVRPIEDWLKEQDLRIVVSRTCHVQIEGDAGLEVKFADAAGKQLFVMSQTQGVAIGGDGWTLRGGKSPVLTVSETAATMTWLRDGKEVGRKTVSLDPTPRVVTTLVAGP